MLSSIKLKYFDAGNLRVQTQHDFISVQHTAKDVSKVQDAYGKFMSFPSHDNFVLFFQTFFKLKSTKEAQREINSLKPVLVGNPIVEDDHSCLDLLLNGCLAYLSVMKADQGLPFTITCILNDLFPFGSANDMKKFLDSSFSSVFSLNQQIAILLWLQPVISERQHFVLGPRKRFPSYRQSLSIIERFEWVAKWLTALDTSRFDSKTPFSQFTLEIKKKNSNGLYGKGTLVIQLANRSPLHVSFSLDQQAVYVLGHLAIFELNNPRPYERTKVSFDVLQPISEKLNLIQDVKGVPFSDSFNKVKGTINKAILKAVQKESPSSFSHHQTVLKNFVMSDNSSIWLNTSTRPIVTGLQLILQPRIVPPSKRMS